MQRLFDGKVYDVVPKTDGIIFSYQKAAVEQGDVVWFKMLSLENALMTDVGKNVYWNTKFGSNYYFALELCENYVTTRALALPSGRLFICTDEGKAYIIDSDGELNREGEIKYRGCAPSAVAFYKNGLWASFSEKNVLLRFNISTLALELRIGGAQSPFDRPEGIFVDGSDAIVCNAGSNSITKVNLDNYTVEEYYTFEEPIHSYAKVNGREFVQLDSGLYVI